MIYWIDLLSDSIVIKEVYQRYDLWLQDCHKQSPLDLGEMASNLGYLSQEEVP